MLNASITVYTALYGSYEKLVEQPISAHSNAKFICFTDDPDLCSDTWEIRVQEPALPHDSIRSARKVKILGFEDLDTDVSVWIDNRIVLKIRPERLVEMYLNDADLALPLHDHRLSVEAEFREVIAAGLDNRIKVREQLEFCTMIAPEVLSEAPLWTAIILRRKSLHLLTAMERWWDQVALFSRRDQLSVNYALKSAGLRVNTFHLPNMESEVHDWLRADKLPKRNDVLYNPGFHYSIGRHILDAVTGNRWSIRVRNKLQRILRSRMKDAP